MPQPGETRTVGTETRQWTGSRWEQVQAPAEPQPEGTLSRFFNGALATSPLNPMNLAHAVAHPIDTAAGMVVDPLVNLFKGVGDVKAAITGERGDRLTSAVQALEHFGGAVPLVGPAGIRAGEKIGNGDVAGGAGELAGLASGALVPEVAERAPGAMVSAGDAMARGGAKLQGGGVNVMGVHVPLSTMGLAEALIRRDPAGLAVAASPYALEYGGKGIAATGRALESLRENFRGSQKPAAEPWDPAGPSKRAASQAKQQAAREQASGVTPEDIGTATVNYRDPSPIPGSEYADALSSHQRWTGGAGANSPEAVPAGMPAQADAMGQQSVRGFRDAGYDVDPEGFRSTKDIDRLQRGSDADAALAALKGRTGPMNPAFRAMAESEPADYDPYSPADGPSFDDLVTRTTNIADQGLGRVSPDAEVPAFDAEGGEWTPPTQEDVPESAVTTTAKQRASLQALMNLPSFRGLR